MTREEKVQYWIDIVADDLDLAEFLCQSGRWLYSAFMCHQVIEKGGVCETTECLVEGTCSRHIGRAARLPAGDTPHEHRGPLP